MRKLPSARPAAVHRKRSEPHLRDHAGLSSTTLALRRRVEKFDDGSAGNGKESLAERTAWRPWNGGFQAARAVAAARWGPAFSRSAKLAGMLSAPVRPGKPRGCVG